MPGHRHEKFRKILAATNGGPVSQDLLLAVLWPNRDQLRNPRAAVRRFIWEATRGTDLRVRSHDRDGDYVLYQAHHA